MYESNHLRLAESELRRVRALHAQDPILRAIVAVDLAVRRVAFGILHWLSADADQHDRAKRARRSSCHS